jgi:TolA-binding protein
LAPANPEKLRATKLDGATMKIYSSALDEMDKKNNAKAKALFLQVLDKFPEFEPAKTKLAKVS